MRRSVRVGDKQTRRGVSRDGHQIHIDSLKEACDDYW